MKRLVAILFFLTLLLVAAALLAPGFIDWSQHKDRLISQLEPYLGRKIEVGGQVKFRLLPNPQILLEDVSLANAPGASAPTFMKLKQLEAHIKFQPLLQGRFEVETINLANPEINLEILDDGTPDWTGILKERDAGGGLENEADAIQLNQVTITGGALHYLNHVTGAEWQVDNLDLAVSADTLFGPYRISGDMQYKGTQVSVEIGAGKFGAGPVPLHVAFNPVEKLPQVKLEGTIDMQGDAAPPPADAPPDAPPSQDALAQNPPPASQPGPALRGDLSVSEGNLASLFDSEFLQSIGFLNDNADFGATLLLKGDEIKLSDIKAKFGKKGELSGSLNVGFEKGKKPVLTADLSGSNLKIAEKPGYIGLPEGLDMRLKLKGKAISWGGVTLPAAALTGNTDGEKWAVKSARIDLPGKSVVKLTGAATPSKQYAAYNMELSTEDLDVMFKSLPLASGNVLKSLEGGVIRKFTFSGSVDLKPGNMSFSDINAKIEDKVKISGVLNTALDQKKPGFSANLNLEDADMSVFPAEAWSAFADRLMKSEGDIGLSVKNFSKGDLKVAAFSFTGAVGEGGLQIKDMSGSFDETGDFKLSGKLATLAPALSVDLDYTLKSRQPGAVAKALGISLPPPLKNDAGLDIHGHAGGEAKKYTFDADGTTDGHGFTLQGTAETGEDGVEKFHDTLKLKKSETVLQAALGLPLDKLLGAGESPTGGEAALSAEISGTHAVYKMDKIKAGSVTGWLSRKDTKYDGELQAGTLDFDSWLAEGWSLKNETKLVLKAKKLLWRGDEISDPELTLEASADHLKVLDLKGGLWGGTLAAELDATRKDDAWNGKLKGTAAGVDLGALVKLMEFKGVTAGNGDLAFDLKADEKAEAKDWFHGIDGTVDAKAESLTVNGFAPGRLPDMIAAFKHLPEHLAEQMTGAMNSGSTTYKDVDGKFKLAGGKFTIEKLKLADADAVTTVAGGLDLGPSTYHLTGTVQLSSPSGVPSFTVNRTGGLKDAPDYTFYAGSIGEYLTKRTKKEEPPVPPVVPPIAGGGLPPLDGATPPPPGPLPPPVPLTGTDKPITIPDDSGAMNPGTSIDTPIETEPLAAPAPANPPVDNVAPSDKAVSPPVPPAPPPETPLPAPPAPDVPSTAPNTGAIKGILDRLNEAPPADSPPPDDQPPKH